MADLSGIDYSKYLSWEKVVLPSGKELYIVPGTGYAYDPFLSASKGQPVLWDNPKSQLEKNKVAEDQQNEILRQQKFNNSPAGQYGPIAAVATAPILAKTAVDAFFPSAAEQAAKAALQASQQAAAQTAAQTGSTAAANAAAQAAGQATAQTASEAASQAAMNVNGIGPVADGGQYAANLGAAPVEGSYLTTAPGTFGQAVGGVAGAYGAYKAIDAWQHGESGRAGLTMAGAGLGSIASPLGAVVGAVGGNLIGYGLQGDGWKNHAVLGMVAPPLEIARLAGLNPIHKTTKQYQQEKTAQLLDKAADDAGWVDTVNAYRNQTPGDHPFAGKYDTWEEYKAAGLEADNLVGTYAVLNTFGPDWLKYSPDQKKQIIQGMIDADILESKKGDVVTTDEDKAKSIRDSVLGTGGATTTPTSGTPTVNPARSSTLSPGIDLNGNKINYKTLPGRLAARLDRRA